MYLHEFYIYHTGNYCMEDCGGVRCHELPLPLDARLSAAGAAGVRLEAHPLSQCSWGVARATAAFGAASRWHVVCYHLFQLSVTIQISMIQHRHW